MLSSPHFRFKNGFRIGYMTDSHLQARRPSGRVDNFGETVLGKTRSAIETFNQAGCDMVVHGGDVFNIPTVSETFLTKVQRVFSLSKAPIYVVPGSHDLFGYNMKNVDCTSLGVMASGGVVNLLWSMESLDIELSDSPGTVQTHVRIEANECHDDIDKDLDRYTMKTGSDFGILFSHSMLVDHKFFDPYTLISELVTYYRAPGIITPNAVFTGHYHPGFAEVRTGSCVFANPGSIARYENSVGNQTRIPQVMIVDVYLDANSNIAINTNYVSLPYLPSKQVFDMSVPTQKMVQQVNMNSLKSSFANITAVQNSSSPVTMLTDIQKSNDPALDTDMKAIIEKHLIAYMACSKNKIPELSGFTPTGPVWIEELELINWQGHGKTIFKFDKGMNVITGPSSAGKSSALRAIEFLFYGSYSKATHIKLGQKNTSVTARLSNKYTIQRTRTRTDTGKIIITDPTGKTNTYTKFGNNFPIDVYNATQCPPVYISPTKKTSLSIKRQHSGAFLIQETPKDAALYMGRLAGCQFIDDITGLVNSEAKTYENKATIVDNEVETKKAELAKYDDLDAEIQDQASFKNEFAAIEQKVILYNQIVALNDELRKAKSDLTNLCHSYGIATPEEFNEIKKNLFTVRDKLLLTKAAYDIFKEAVELHNKRVDTEDFIANDPSIKLLSANLLDANTGRAMCASLKERVRKLSLISDDFDRKAELDTSVLLLTGKVQELSEVKPHIEKASSLKPAIKNLITLLELRNAYNICTNAVTRAGEDVTVTKELVIGLTETLYTAREDYREFLKKENYCPTCHTQLTTDQIEKIVGGEKHEHD